MEYWWSGGARRSGQISTNRPYEKAEVRMRWIADTVAEQSSDFPGAKRYRTIEATGQVCRTTAAGAKEERFTKADAAEAEKLLVQRQPSRRMSI